MINKVNNKSICSSCGSVLCETGVDFVRTNVMTIYSASLNKYGGIDYEFVEEDFINSPVDPMMCCSYCLAELGNWDEQLAKSILMEANND